MDFKSNIKEFNELKQKMSTVSQGSSTYEKLAYYIEKNYKNIIFMTAAEVAIQANVSQGSVSRFCSSLGYRGYNDFLQNLQHFVRGEITAPQRLQYTSQDNNRVSSILDMEHKNINELESILNQPTYEELVKKIVSAKELVLISSRMSATLLPYTYYILNKMRNGVVEITPSSPLWDTVNLRNPQTTQIFAIMFPRYPNKLIKKLEELKKEGFSIAAITDTIISPITHLADPLISIPVTTSSIFDIYSTPVLFLNLLLRDVAREIKGLDERLSKLEEVERINNIYYKNSK